MKCPHMISHSRDRLPQMVWSRLGSSVTCLGKHSSASSRLCVPPTQRDLGQILQSSDVAYLSVPRNSVPHKGFNHLNYVTNLIPLLVLPVLGQYRYLKNMIRNLSFVRSVIY